MRSSQTRSRVSSAMGVLASFNLGTLVNAGSTRYRPPNSTQPASAYSDSYLGGSRHNSIGTSAITPPASSSSFNDPFTGPSRYVPGSTTTMSQPPVSTISIIPTVGLKHGARKLFICVAVESSIVQAGECLCYARQALPIRPGSAQRDCKFPCNPRTLLMSS